ncbi:MAG TPA: aldehyde dehydrogenase family protein [Mycobacterium sp.]|nr:aldehyde dehydrogenase family protein [Mycobacterium sp.]
MTHSVADQTLADLTAAKPRWAGLSIADKLGYLERLRPLVRDAAAEWVAAAVKAKGIPAGSPLAGEEWISGPYAVLSWMTAAIETLAAVAAGDNPLKGCPIRQRRDGQTIVRVYPHDLTERLLLHGFSAEVWMRPGTTPASLPEEIATRLRRQHGQGKVTLVLGAGNIASIPLLDALYKLYTDGEVVVLKMNPVNAYLGPIFEKALAPLVADGYLRFVYGGGDVGAHLCKHPSVDTIHITGSEHTHDLIVYGAGDEGAARKLRNEPVIDKPITSELGGVGPTIIVPGPWTTADFRFQAEHVATQKLHNSGFNCIASQVVVLPRDWDGATHMVDALRAELDTAPPRPAYYPGAEDRRLAATARYAGAEQLGAGGATRTLITGVDPGDTKAHAFTEEFFGPVQATTALPGRDAAEFLRNAVHFANDTLHGTLGVNLIIHPRTIAELGPAHEEAIAELRYGTVAVNAWTGVGYLTPRASWGAFPGHSYDDVQSGIGVVHNALFFDRPQKTVVRAPFRPFPRSVAHAEFALSPRPPWFVTNRTAEVTGRRLTYYAADGKLRHLPGIFTSALQG